VPRDRVQRGERERGERELREQRMRGRAHQAAHPATREKSRLKLSAVVFAENRRIASIEIRGDHIGCEFGQAYRSVEPSSRERRHRPGGIADEQAAIVGDHSQNSVDRNQSAATLDGTPTDDVLHSFSELGESFAGLESFAISSHSDVRRFSVSGNPSDVTRREPRVDEAV